MNALDLRPHAAPVTYRPGPGRALDAWSVTVTRVPEPGALGAALASVAALHALRRGKA